MQQKLIRTQFVATFIATIFLASRYPVRVRQFSPDTSGVDKPPRLPIGRSPTSPMG